MSPASAYQMFIEMVSSHIESKIISVIATLICLLSFPPLNTCRKTKFLSEIIGILICLVLRVPICLREHFAGFNFTSASGSNLIFIDGVTSEQIMGVQLPLVCWFLLFQRRLKKKIEKFPVYFEIEEIP
jgi:hypothetical protein